MLTSWAFLKPLTINGVYRNEDEVLSHQSDELCVNSFSLHHVLVWKGRISVTDHLLVRMDLFLSGLLVLSVSFIGENELFPKGLN